MHLLVDGLQATALRTHDAARSTTNSQAGTRAFTSSANGSTRPHCTIARVAVTTITAAPNAIQ